ncbi:MAG: hypothetical protein ACRCZP_04830 [Phycicoccus sp.]
MWWGVKGTARTAWRRKADHKVPDRDVILVWRVSGVGWPGDWHCQDRRARTAYWQPCTPAVAAQWAYDDAVVIINREAP